MAVTHSEANEHQNQDQEKKLLCRKKRFCVVAPFVCLDSKQDGCEGRSEEFLKDR